MAGGVNKVILVGNLGKDPEVRYIQSGNAVCTLRLAITERRKDGENGWKDHTEWMDVVTWGKTAENAGQYLAKGRQIYVEGRIQTRQYKDKDGNDRYKTEVVANQVLFLGGGDRGAGAGGPRKDAGGGRPAQGNPGQQGSQGQGSQMGDDDAPPPDQGGGGFIDDDLPF
jgi:single-strand DNA-binding protein